MGCFRDGGGVDWVKKLGKYGKIGKRKGLAKGGNSGWLFLTETGQRFGELAADYGCVGLG